MKVFLIAATALLVTAPAFAQSGADMKAMPGMSNMQGATNASMTIADGVGVVKVIDHQAGAVTIRHGPISALHWSAMTMAFKATSPALLDNVTLGESVKFQLMQMDGVAPLTAIGAK